MSQGLSTENAAEPESGTKPSVRIRDKAEYDTSDDVWGYLISWDLEHGAEAAVLKERCACPPRNAIRDAAEAESKGTEPYDGEDQLIHDEEAYERTKVAGSASCGYLIGSHPECGK